MRRNQTLQLFSAKFSSNSMLLGLMIFTIALGLIFGGSPNQPGWRYILIMFASASLFVVAVKKGAWTAVLKLGWLPKLLLILIVLLPILQLIPLPPVVWQSFPGRELEYQVLDLVDVSGQWHPISINPIETLYLFTTLLAPAAVFTGAMLLDREELKLVMTVVVLIALVSVLVGLFQFSSAGNIFNFYNNSHKRFLLGFFANRNHQGLFLAIALAIGVSLVFQARAEKKVALAVAGLVAFFCFGAVVGTASRSGLSLTVLSAALIFLAHLGWGKRPWIAGAGVFLAGIVIFLVFQATSNVFDNVFERYNDVTVDGRWEYWKNSVAIAQSYLPFGSGLGTFVSVYKSAETLEQITPFYANHVHNDYLELVLEAGIAGVIVIGLTFLTAGVAIISGLRARKQSGLWYAAAVTIVVILGHSVVDYPLRTQALAMLFAFSLAVMFRLQKAPV